MVKFEEMSSESSVMIGSEGEMMGSEVMGAEVMVSEVGGSEVIGSRTGLKGRVPEAIVSEMNVVEVGG